MRAERVRAVGQRTAFGALVGSALLTAISCASHPIEVRSVLLIDAASLPAAEPVDLQALALSRGCAESAIDPWQFVTVTVESVVQPCEFVVRGRYGLERVRLRLPGSAVGRLQQLAGHEDEIVARFSAALVGQEFLEPSDDDSPVASTDGLRLVRLMTPDGKLLAESLDEILESVADERGLAAAAGDASRASPDLGVVPLAEDALRLRVARAVEQAERCSEFRAPAALVVERIDFDHPPWLSETLRTAWQRDAGPCLGTESATLREVFDWGAVGLSLPGGTIYLDSRLRWCELELEFALLHELMHQHQYALCADGTPMGTVPGALREAHASSLAREILLAPGPDAAALDFVVQWDSFSAAVQAFDSWRQELRLTPDQALLHLAADPEAAQQLSRQIEFGYFCCTGPAASDTSGPLTFEIVDGSGTGLVLAIVNDSDRPFSGFLNGLWHFSTSESASVFSGGTPPFALRIPPHGRVVVQTSVGSWKRETIESCHAGYRETPAPVFEPE